MATVGGACRYVAVRVVIGTVATEGFPAGHQLAIYPPGEPVSSYACTIHVDDITKAMNEFGLEDVHVEALPDPSWSNDGADRY